MQLFWNRHLAATRSCDAMEPGAYRVQPEQQRADERRPVCLATPGTRRRHSEPSRARDRSSCAPPACRRAVAGSPSRRPGGFERQNHSAASALGRASSGVMDWRLVRRRRLRCVCALRAVAQILPVDGDRIYVMNAAGDLREPPPREAGGPAASAGRVEPRVLAMTSPSTTTFAGDRVTRAQAGEEATNEPQVAALDEHVVVLRKTMVRKLFDLRLEGKVSPRQVCREPSRASARSAA